MTGIWRRAGDPESFARSAAGCLPGMLGIRILEIGPDFVRASMPVAAAHLQPHGILHGGASVVLAETVGSYCANLAAEPGGHCVGVEVNANHLASVVAGDEVTALCRPVRLGRQVQVWTIEIRRGDGTLTCVSRLTTMLREARAG